jgi:hypothetical protein
MRCAIQEEQEEKSSVESKVDSSIPPVTAVETFTANLAIQKGVCP